MFEQLPFYDGKILNYKQFFFYLFLWVYFCMFTLFLIADVVLNIWMYYYKRNRGFYRIEEVKRKLTKYSKRSNELKDMSNTSKEILHKAEEDPLHSSKDRESESKIRFNFLLERTILTSFISIAL